MKVLITGASGQLGWELRRTAPEGWDIHTFDSNALDITQAGTVKKTLATIRPQYVINAAAYTAVDKAETEFQKAYEVNAEGAANVAKSALEAGARLLHVSTDFIFDGESSRPYQPIDKPNPIGVYGASKLEGENRVAEIYHGDVTILRTAWVYSVHGANFVKTMLRLMKERDRLNIISDQIGTPTWAGKLAQAIWKMTAMPELKGYYHWTDAGVASWYDFAVAIYEEACSIELLQKPVEIHPIGTKDYPLPARRPSFSVLDKTDTWAVVGEAQHWRWSLREMLRELKEANYA